MKLAIYTLQSVIFKGDVERVTLPTLNGEITLLERHLPLVTIVSRGAVRFRLPNGPASSMSQGGEESAVFLEGGIFEMRPESEAVMLADG